MIHLLVEINFFAWLFLCFFFFFFISYRCLLEACRLDITHSKFVFLCSILVNSFLLASKETVRHAHQQFIHYTYRYHHVP